MLTFFTLILTGCQEKATKKSSSSSSNNNTSCTGQAYWTTPGCTGYCQYNPSAYGCSGSTTGGTTGSTTGGTTGSTTGGSTGGVVSGACAANPAAAYCSATYCSGVVKPYGCLANGTNCFIYPSAAGCGGSSSTVPRNPNWGMFYPPANNPPAGSCSPTFDPPGLTGATATRKATITIAGAGRNTADPATEYSPFHTHAPNYLNTSTMLKSVGQAKMFFLTDSILKMRVKVLPEPEAFGTTGVCYNRGTGSYVPGYTKLQYTVTVYGTSSSNAVSYLGMATNPETGTTLFTTSVNNCTPAIDLSDFKESSPTGLIVAINQVKENKNCTTPPPGQTDSYWNNYGWSQCNNFNKVRSMECWSMEFEVAADGTKTFN